MKKLVEIKNLKKYFPVYSTFTRKLIGRNKAVDDVSFDIFEGEILGLVGESGCGKTTMARLLLNIIEPTSGDVLFEGNNIYKLGAVKMRRLREDMQIIFQDPYNSLDPTMKIRDIVTEPIEAHKKLSNKQKNEFVEKLLSSVGLSADLKENYPHQFSGGQRQRIGIARALATNPRFIICDEPVSSLDVSIQAQIINLLRDLQEKNKTTYLFITHDLRLVEYLSDRVAVMYLGKIMELAPSEILYRQPLHPYTKLLLSSVEYKAEFNTEIQPELVQGERGCDFASRCAYSIEVCKLSRPRVYETNPGHFVACHLVTQISLLKKSLTS